MKEIKYNFNMYIEEDTDKECIDNSFTFYTFFNGVYVPINIDNSTYITLVYKNKVDDCDITEIESYSYNENTRTITCEAFNEYKDYEGKLSNSNITECKVPEIIEEMFFPKWTKCEDYL